MGVKKDTKLCNELSGTQNVQVSRRQCSLLPTSEYPILSTSLFCRKIQIREREECQHTPSLANL